MQRIERENIDSKVFLDGHQPLTLHGNPFITKKRDISNALRPRMYMKVRELLEDVTSDFASEVIEGI